jgi:hypothetical protein
MVLEEQKWVMFQFTRFGCVAWWHIKKFCSGIKARRFQFDMIQLIEADSCRASY